MPNNTTDLVARIEGMSEDEKALVERLVGRLEAGRAQYGPWMVDGDPRRYLAEALEEVLDALQYVAAELIRIERLDEAAQGCARCRCGGGCRR